MKKGKLEPPLANDVIAAADVNELSIQEFQDLSRDYSTSQDVQRRAA